VLGYWNPQEQYPFMIAGGAVHMQKVLYSHYDVSCNYHLQHLSDSIFSQMPAMNAKIDWIPLVYAAASIVEIIINTANDAPSHSESIFHIVSPNRVTWMDYLEALHSNGLKIQ
jgi:hypothetical protein